MLLRSHQQVCPWQYPQGVFGGHLERQEVPWLAPQHRHETIRATVCELQQSPDAQILGTSRASRVSVALPTAAQSINRQPSMTLSSRTRKLISAAAFVSLTAAAVLVA